MVIDSQEQDDRPLAVAVRHIRILGYIVACCVFATGIYLKLYGSSVIVITVVSAFIPWGQSLFRSWLWPRYAGQTDEVIMLTDAAVTGIGIAAAGYGLVPSLTFLGLLLTSAMAFGNLYFVVFLGFIAMIASLIGGLIFGFRILPYESTPAIMTLIAFSGFAVYVSFFTLYISRQTRKLASSQDQALKQQEQVIQILRKLVKYLPPQVWKSIFSGKRDARLQNHRKKLSIFFSDIKDFTEATDEMSPDALTEIINYYFGQMSQIALRYGGTIDKFIGDAILIFFGDPTTKGVKEDALACVSMAIDMHKQMQVLRQKWQSMGVEKPLHIRMGITTGYCHVGNFGSESRMDYTIIGRDANLASRLQSVADPDEILISNDTYLLVRDKIMCREKGMLHLRGIAHPVHVWQVMDFRANFGATSTWIEHEREGFAMLMDIDKVKNNDRENIVKALETAAQRLRNSNSG